MPNSSRPPVAPDPFLPAEIAKRLEAANVARAALRMRSLLLLGLLGGVYISFGAAFATLVLTDSALGYGLSRLAAGVAFSLGLIMLVLAGGELFTGNNLMVLALAGRKIPVSAMLRNWCLVYTANAIGAILTAYVIHFTGVLDAGGVRATALSIAEGKAQLGAPTAFLRGILCNMLVCLAIWLSVAARSVEGKIVAIAFPISAFVALGFEHCIANLYLLPIGMLSGANVPLADLFANIGAVTLGNTVGGVILAATYSLIYLPKVQPHDRAAGETEAAEGAADTKWRVSGMAGWPAVAAKRGPVASDAPAPARAEERKSPGIVTQPEAAMPSLAKAEDRKPPAIAEQPEVAVPPVAKAAERKPAVRTRLEVLSRRPPDRR